MSQQYAIDSGNLDTVEFLLQSGCCPAMTGDEIDRALLRYNVSTDTVDREGWTAAHYLWSFKRDDLTTPLLKILISSSQGICPNSTDLRGWTILHKAAVCGSATQVGLLIAQGADPHLRLCSRTVLHLAAAYNNVAAIAELSRPCYGLDVDATDAAGWSPLHVAAFSGKFSRATVVQLLKLGADARQRSIPTAIAWVPNCVKGKAVTPAGAACARSWEAYQQYRLALGDVGLSYNDEDIADLEGNEFFWDASESL
ncbi:MAG: hypothetical protein Q9160_004541 [Pyrenula sp. 1 TL-2023]